MSNETGRKEAALPLSGIRVLELAQMVAGPSAGLLLADYGAEVLKVEPPNGDGLRKLRGAPAAHLPDSPVYDGYNRNKSVTHIDIRTEEGRAAVQRLVLDADVFIESARPGTMTRLGLGPGELLKLNPRLVYASVSGFGQGPVGSTLGGVDNIVQAESGLMSTTGFPDGPATKVGFTIVDAACGHALCHGILAALFKRERTGVGDAVQVSLYEVALHLQTGPLVEFMVTGEQGKRCGNSAPLAAPADSFRCLDGDIVISAYFEPHWKKFIATIEAPELLVDEKFATSTLRVLNRAALTAAIEKRLAVRRAAEWARLLREQGLLAGEVKDYAAVASAGLTEETQVLVRMGDGFGVRTPIRLASASPAEAFKRTEIGDRLEDVHFL